MNTQQHKIAVNKNAARGFECLAEKMTIITQSGHKNTNYQNRQ